MNDETTSPDVESAAGPRAGERLAEARRLRQISLPDIARELHLDEPKVQALEENRFDILGAPVFAKGHLRKYAEIVGISADEVIADYRSLTTADVAPPIVGEPRPRQRDINIAPWIIAIPVFVVVLAAAYWWLSRAQQNDAARDRQEIVQPLPQGLAATSTPPPQSPPPAAGIADDAAAAPAEAAPLAEAEPVTDNAAPAPPPPRNAGEVTMVLTFSGDCWTEVTDASGERLYFDLGKSGRSVSVSGTAPLRVLLGDRNNVRVTVNGRPYAISDAEFRGDTARLTINE